MATDPRHREKRELPVRSRLSDIGVHIASNAGLAGCRGLSSDEREAFNFERPRRCGPGGVNGLSIRLGLPRRTSRQCRAVGGKADAFCSQ
ncbi:hypothetical protein MRX96_013059 [Rhipicephalus microplus]